MCKFKKKRDVQNAKARIALLCDTNRRLEAEVQENKLEVEQLRKFIQENSEK